MLARMLGCRHVELAETVPGGSRNETTVRATQGKTSKLLTPGTKYNIELYEENGSSSYLSKSKRTCFKCI